MLTDQIVTLRGIRQWVKKTPPRLVYIDIYVVYMYVYIYDLYIYINKKQIINVLTTHNEPIKENLLYQ